MKEKLKNYKATIFLWSVILILLLAYFCIMFMSISNLMNQVELIVNRPYKVLGYTNDIAREVDKIKICNESIKYNISAKNIETQEQQIEKINDNIDKTFENLNDSILSVNENNVKKFRKNVDELKNYQAELFKQIKTNNYTLKDISNYEKKNMTPIFTEINNIIDNMHIRVNNNVNIFHDKAANTKTLAQSVFVTAFILIIGTLILYQVFLNRKNKIIVYKNSVFDIISKNIDQGIFLYNPNNENETFVSSSAEKLFGFSYNNVSNRRNNIIKYIDKEDLKKMQELNNKNKKQNWSYTFSYNHPISKKTMNIKMVENYIETGVNPTWLTVFSDETEQVIYQENLKSALDKAEKASMAKSEFLSKMSHEIRTPLNGIIGKTLIAIQNIGNQEKELDCLNKINSSSNHLLELLNDILDMSKIESGKIEIKNEKFNFRVFVESITSLYSAEAKEKNINFKTIQNSNTEEYLYGDSLRLNQIITNLISNSLKFTPENGSIKLNIIKISENDKEILIRFEVSDTGCGINSNHFDKIFKSFEQEYDGTTRKYGGTGLGLSISKSLTELMGGKITVESEEGIGSNFIVEIPFSKNLDEKSKQTANFGHLKVLLIEDNENERESTLKILNKIGVVSQYSDDAYTAINKLKDSDFFNICLIDNDIHSIDGIEMIKRTIETSQNNISVLLISENPEEIREKALKAGAVDVLDKPLSESSLLKAFDMINDYDFNNKNTSKVFSSDILKNKNVLIVEDNELNMEIITEILNMGGANTSCAHNGRDAVTMFNDSDLYSYDIILMDIQMPILNGYDAAKEIRASGREDAKSIIIIAISANSFKDDIQKTFDSGMDGHLRKPIELNKLYDTIGEIIAKK